MKEVPFTVGDVVVTRKFPNAKFPDLVKHKVIGIVTLGDGTVIVEHG